jgi:hypothetical protein
MEEIEVGGNVARMRERRDFHRVLVGRREGKRPLEITRRRWDDNIKMELMKLGIHGTNWIWLAQVQVQW